MSFETSMSQFFQLSPLGSVRRGAARDPHLVIRSENYHALQLLQYTHAGAVDVIYIDPPYNTGAQDWQYNNDYVDKNDRWRHSKWLSFMEKRLRLAKPLLKDDGVLIITVDDMRSITWAHSSTSFTRSMTAIWSRLSQIPRAHPGATLVELMSTSSSAFRS